MDDVSTDLKAFLDYMGGRPSDYAFSGDGIVFADRTVKPAIQEVKYYYGTYK